MGQHKTQPAAVAAYRQAMDMAPMAMIMINEKGRITFWNKWAERIFGWTEEEILDKTLSETIIPAAYREAHLAGLEHYNQTGKAHTLNKSYELSAIDKSGREFPVEITICETSDEFGNTRCGYIREVKAPNTLPDTDLVSNKEFWLFALEGAGDGAWGYDLEHRKAFFSKQSLGYEDDEFENNPEAWVSHMHPDDLKIFLQTMQDYRDKKITAHRREYRMRHKDGRYLWISDRGMAISFCRDGTPKKVIGTYLDITEKKLAEQATRNNEEKYRNIIANINMGLVEVDLDEVIQFVNQSFCQMSGYTAEELTGKNMSNLFLRGDNVHFMKVKMRQRRKGVSDAYRIAVKNKRGEAKWWLISGAPRYNDNGTIAGTISITLDITEQHQLETELIEARRHAEAQASSRQIFMANMSHEIRTPLNAILGIVRQLEKTPLTEQQEFFLKIVHEASENLLVVIGDILDSTKLEAGKLTLEQIGFRPAALVAKTLKVMQQHADEKKLLLTGNVDEAVAGVLIGDPHRLNQVLLNLLSNAIKFSDKGKITVCCRLLRRIDKQQLVEISVSDEGIGMEKDFIANLFEVFAQENRSTTNRHAGTGLGMSITKHLVHLMGGSISVTSEPNQGTTITMQIPFITGEENDIPCLPAAPAEQTSFRGKKILLAEDNEINRLVATTTLNHYEATITEAGNGKQAVDWLQNNRADLVLMDIQMPVMDGYAAAKLIREELKLDVPIIAITANALKGEKEKCIHAGMNDYISKPFNEEQLINMMARWLKVEPREKEQEKEQVTEKLYSLEGLKEISRGSNEFVRKMIQLFCTQVPDTMRHIREALEIDDLSGVSALAHKIKPSINNLRIDSLKQDVAQLEKLAPERKHLARVHVLVDRVAQVIEEVVEDLKKEII